MRFKLFWKISLSTPPRPLPTFLRVMFFRTRVADFVLREFQAAWGVVPTSGGAGSQYDIWVSRVIADPTLQTTGGDELSARRHASIHDVVRHEQRHRTGHPRCCHPNV